MSKWIEQAMEKEQILGVFRCDWFYSHFLSVFFSYFLFISKPYLELFTWLRRMGASMQDLSSPFLQ